jgi:hypothetical protein
MRLAHFRENGMSGGIDSLILIELVAADPVLQNGIGSRQRGNADVSNS